MRADWGIVGDAHAGNWHRQVSLLAGGSIDRVKQLMPDLARGAFAENIITRGVELTSLKIGARLAIGDDIVLEVTQIGKKCRHGCVIKQTTGDCIMPREGIFAKVLNGGLIWHGLSVQIQLINSNGTSNATDFEYSRC